MSLEETGIVEVVGSSAGYDRDFVYIRWENDRREKIFNDMLPSPLRLNDQALVRVLRNETSAEIEKVLSVTRQEPEE